MSGYALNDVPDQTGRNILITGANSGIGYAAAEMLAGKGARVLVTCRDEAKGRAAMAKIAGRHPASDLAFLKLDLADLGSVQNAARQVDTVDVLINNAGVMRPPHSFTADGFELQFGVNHLAHFLLTGLLLPKLARGTDPRVVTVSSIAHRRGEIFFDNLDGRKGYDDWEFYGQSKLANALFFTELDRRLQAAGSPVKSTGCHPGLAQTGIARNSAMDLLIPLAGMVFNSAHQGAMPTLQAATDPEAKGGAYYGPQQWKETRGPSGPGKLTDQARDPELAARLWDVSSKLTGFDPGLAPA